MAVCLFSAIAAQHFNPNEETSANESNNCTWQVVRDRKTGLLFGDSKKQFLFPITRLTPRKKAFRAKPTPVLAERIQEQDYFYFLLAIGAPIA